MKAKKTLTGELREWVRNTRRPFTLDEVGEKYVELGGKANRSTGKADWQTVFNVVVGTPHVKLLAEGPRGSSMSPRSTWVYDQKGEYEDLRPPVGRAALIRGAQ